MLNRKTYLRRLCEKLLREANEARENPFSEGDMALHQFTPDVPFNVKTTAVIYDCKKFFDMSVENGPTEGPFDDDLTMTWIYQTSIIGFLQQEKDGTTLRTGPDEKQKFKGDVSKMKANNEKIVKAFDIPEKIFNKSSNVAAQNWYFDKSSSWDGEEPAGDKSSGSDDSSKKKAQEDDIAFFYQNDGGTITSVAYDATSFLNSMKEAIKRGENVGKFVRYNTSASILGMIQLKEPGSYGKCNDAWEVKKSAGEGYGKLVYGMGYHVSGEVGSGWLMPDRKTISDKARNAWRSVRKKSKGKPLDNIKHDKDNFVSDKFHDEYHTEDKSDDCITWPISPSSPGKYAINSDDDGGVEDAETQDAVNRAYAMGDMGYDFSKFSAKHENVIENLEKLGIKRDSIEGAFLDSALAKFGSDFVG